MAAELGKFNARLKQPLHAKVHDEEDSTTDELRRFLQRSKFKRYEISKQANAMLRFNIISGAREVAEFALPSFWSQKRLQPICDECVPLIAR
jgi:hypothetical protein